MHFHYPSFLIGLLLGIVLIVLAIIFLICLLFQLSVREDERLFRIQKNVDDYEAEDNIPK